MLPWGGARGTAWAVRPPLLLGGVALTATLALRGGGAAPQDWNPAGFELLGNGRLALAYGAQGWRSELSLREGALALHAVGGEAGNAVALARALPGPGPDWPLTVATGVSGTGPLFGAALGLGGHGELWGRSGLRPHSWAAGGALLLADRTWLRGDVSPAGGRLWFTAALPILPGEGHPLRLGAGYGFGAQRGPALNLAGRLGAHELEAGWERRGFGLRLSTGW